MEARAIDKEVREIPGIRPYFEFGEEALETIRLVLESGRASNNGPFLQQFEKELAAYLGVREAVVVSTGFDGLLLSAKALTQSGGKAILPAYTYIATLNAVVHAGLEPVFCDIDEGTYTMDPAHLDLLLQRHQKVACVIPVNAFGVTADLPKIRSLCDSSGARLLYDNAHGLGTEVNGQRFEREPDVQVFSLHATKTLPAVEGGLVISDDAQLLAKIRQLRNHGLAASVADTIPGYNAKMDEIRAVIGLESLKHFTQSLQRRREYGHRLTQRFLQYPEVYRPQVVPSHVQTNYQNLGVRCLPAADLGLNAVMEMFRSEGIGVRPYFDPPLYQLEGFNQELPLPPTEKVWRTLISFPIHSRMEEAALLQIEAAISKVAERLQSRG